VRENVSAALGFNVESNGDRDTERRDRVARFIDEGLRREDRAVQLRAAIVGRGLALLASAITGIAAALASGGTHWIRVMKEILQ
jgi:hypothetical protein